MARSPEPPSLVTFEKGADLSATFRTSAGTIVCKLFANDCPITVGNFVGLATGKTAWTDPTGNQVERPLYDGTVFHRVIPDFMIQGGDPLGNGTGGPGYRFGDEIVAHLKHCKPGVLSMANSGPDANGSQFFITEVPTPWLDGKHTVFGEVIAGLDVVQRIAHSPTGANSKPEPRIVLESVTVSS